MRRRVKFFRHAAPNLLNRIPHHMHVDLLNLLLSVDSFGGLQPQRDYYSNIKAHWSLSNSRQFFTWSAIISPHQNQSLLWSKCSNMFAKFIALSTILAVAVAAPDDTPARRGVHDANRRRDAGYNLFRSRKPMVLLGCLATHGGLMAAIWFTQVLGLGLIAKWIKLSEHGFSLEMAFRKWWQLNVDVFRCLSLAIFECGNIFASTVNLSQDCRWFWHFWSSSPKYDCNESWVTLGVLGWL